ncbi:MAG: hypothetical protein IJT14_00520 [Rickettsiales bacterium]|nr:hypothetical protein [Rickettsiales bacterium]
MQRVIALDTEFDRRTTYRPTLSIVQVKCGAQEEPKIYDVLGHSDDLNELMELLRDDEIVKVIHAARQDFECIYCQFGITMHNVFDTQIAAKHLGFGDEIGYAQMVKEFCDKKIVKEHKLQVSDWLKRPLTQKQIFYAKQDVEYLHLAYERMQEHFLTDSKLYEDFLKECQAMENDSLYRFNPLTVWEKMHNKFRIVVDQSFARDLFITREREANIHNLPREFVLTNKDLILFANTKNKNILQKLHKKVSAKPFLQCLAWH